MRIFLTGATGFIGRALMPLLEDHLLLVLDRQGTLAAAANRTTLKANMADPAGLAGPLEDFAPDACIHLAWEGLPDYGWQTSCRNFNMNIDLLDTLGRIGCRKVFISGTCWEYGDLNGRVTEQDTPGKRGLFPSFKARIYDLGKRITAEYGLELTWGRIFFAYGPGQRAESLIPHCISSIRQDAVPQLRQPGAVNDFIHVLDVARAIHGLAVTPNTPGIFNIASGKPYTVSAVVRRVAAALGKEWLLGPETAAAGSGFWGDISKITAATGVVPQVSLDEGIRHMIESLA